MKQCTTFSLALVAVASAVKTTQEDIRTRIGKRIAKLIDNTTGTVSTAEGQTQYELFDKMAKEHRDENGRLSGTAGYTEALEAQNLANYNAKIASEASCVSMTNPDDFFSPDY